MTQNNLISIVTMRNKVNELSRESLSRRHEKLTRSQAETTGNRYGIGTSMSRMQGRKGLSADSLRLKTLSDNS